MRRLHDLANSILNYKVGIRDLPISYTLGLTYNCNSKCKTCRVYEKPRTDSMTPEEWKMVFAGLGQSPYWVTFTGGEPFLYRDFIEVYYDLVSMCKPAIVNIPTNGIMTERIIDWVWQMSRMSQRTQIVVNVSIDHFKREVNDYIRGTVGHYVRAVDTVTQLRRMSQSCSNLKVGIHTVISKFNVDDFQQTAEALSGMLDDKSLYIAEVAEQRFELGTVGLDITPDALSWGKAVEWLAQSKTLKGLFRSRYYNHVERNLRGESSKWKCQAGKASCQIAPDGEVWFCCIRANSVGNLRQSGYDFRSIWKGTLAEEERKTVKSCSCPMANVSYTNMLMDIPTMMSVATEKVRR